ncbi:roadblock/LC7 domain-containing protein [Luedemannella helvata]|uniref:Roadblock/LC7 domain-containing protein n=1 Tax=Luedemannella helvata TaxID=349315 RepID=A0ABP4X7B7_9ACTN
MTAHTEPLSSEAQQFNWLLSQFAVNTSEVIDAIAVSSDGLLIAMSHTLDRSNADRLAAITSAIISLAHGAARVYDMGSPNKVIIDLDGGYLLVSAISSGATLGVLASRAANLGNLAYEMAVFANRAGEFLSPVLIEELKNSVGM